MKIKTINELEFKYFNREELVKLRKSIDARIFKIDGGLKIKKRPIYYYASVEVMYGDADGFVDALVSISKEDYHAIENNGEVKIEFFNEFMGSPSGDIDEFVNVFTDSRSNLATTSYCSELDSILEEIEMSLINED